MFDKLAWSAIEPDPAHAMLVQLLGVEDEGLSAPFAISGRVAPLPFYKHWRLVVLSSIDHQDATPTPLEDTYALWREGRPPVLLDGTSAPVHEINANESLELAESDVADYIRWFCFAVRADDAPFILFEQLPPKVAKKHKAAAKHVKPLAPRARDADGNVLCDASVIFSGSLFAAVFSVPTDGTMTMVDDDHLMADFPAALTPAVPTLGLGPSLRTHLWHAQGVIPTLPMKRRPAPSSRPTVVEMVDILLGRALRDQTKNRLLGYFNAALPSASAQQLFAALMKSSSPVVIVETNIPFVEEAIAEIVNGLLAPTPLPIYRGQVEIDSSGQESLDKYELPNQGPAVVLIPL